MRCRYCGAENPESDVRCAKCQRRLVPIAVTLHEQRFPFVETAAAPALRPDGVPQDELPRPRLAAARGGAEQRIGPPVQPALFPYRQSRKVVGLEEYAAPQPLRRSADLSRSASKRKAPPGQGAFDFDAPAPPSRPLTREIHRRSDYAVAPLHLRAMAVVFDAGLAAGFLGAFLLTVRLCLGSLPFESPFLGAYAVAGVSILLVYKLLWCASGRVSLGLQGAHLHIVSFDGLRPTPAQRFMRLFAACLSVASAGMGVVWALSDQESLTWHDHISQTMVTHQPPEEDF